MEAKEVRFLQEAYASIYEEDERSPEANAAKQEAAKEAAQKRREAQAKPKSTLQRETNPADDASIRNRIRLKMQQQFGSQSGAGSGG